MRLPDFRALGSELKASEELDMWILGTFGLDKLSHRPFDI